MSDVDAPRGPHRLFNACGRRDDGSYLGLSAGTATLPPGWYQFEPAVGADTVRHRWYLSGVVLAVNDMETDRAIDAHLHALTDVCVAASRDLDGFAAGIAAGDGTADLASIVTQAMSYVDVIQDLAQQAAVVTHRMTMPDGRKPVRFELVERADRLVIDAAALCGTLSETADIGESRMRQPQRRPKLVGRNDPCPCGSGRKYKLCCQQRRVGRG